MRSVTYPADEQAERLVLAEMLADFPACAESLTLEPGEFFSDRHTLVFGAILDVYRAGGYVDPLTVANRLEESGALARVGGRDWMADLAGEAWSAHGFIDHQRIVREKAALRSLMRACGTALDRARNQEAPGEILDDLREKLLGVAGREDVESWIRTPEQYARDLQGKYEIVREVRFRFRQLNEYIDCFTPGELMIIGAGGGVGKTGFSYQLANSIAHEQDEKFAFVSMEMSDIALHQRIMSIAAHAKNPKMTRKSLIQMVQNHKADMAFMRKTIDQRQITIPRGGLTIEDLEKVVRISAKKHGVKTVVVDYLGFLLNTHGKSTYESVSYNVKRCKAIALDSGVRFILLSQLNNEGEDGTVPVKLHYFRDSGVIKETADYAIGLWKDVDDEGNTIILHGKVLKNRTSGIEKKFDLEVNGTYYQDCVL